MHTRILTAILGIPLLIVVINLGSIPLLIGVILLSSVGLQEVYRTFQIKKENKINRTLEMILNSLCLIIMDLDSELILPYIIFLFIFHFSYQLFTKSPSFESGLLGFIGIIYVGFMLGHLLLFNKLMYGKYLIWLVFIIAFATDTFAYFIGTYLGKTKLCSNISPKKTVEGSIGGIFGSLLVCILYGIYLNEFQNISISLVHFIILGIFASIISQFGDLTASLIKRNYGIKDFGKIFPGHGGILDRFDSIIFVAPAVYYYMNILL